MCRIRKKSFFSPPSLASRLLQMCSVRGMDRYGSTNTALHFLPVYPLVSVWFCERQWLAHEIYLAQCRGNSTVWKRWWAWYCDIRAKLPGRPSSQGIVCPVIITSSFVVLSELRVHYTPSDGVNRAGTSSLPFMWHLSLHRYGYWTPKVCIFFLIRDVHVI